MEINTIEEELKQGTSKKRAAYLDTAESEEVRILGEDSNIVSMNPLVLAYIGDVTYEKEVRKRIVSQNPNDKISMIHKKTVEFSKAISQSKVINALKEADVLTEREWYFVKRGRNTQSTAPKNANVTDYRYATGFETMLGYLDLSGQQSRIGFIVDFAFEVVNG